MICTKQHNLTSSDTMRDFLIPSFEQFQYFRELQKAERKKKKQAETKKAAVPAVAATTTTTTTTLKHPDPKKSPLQVYITNPLLLPSIGSSQPISPVQDNNNNDDDDDDADDSATEVGTPLAKIRSGLEDEDNDDHGDGSSHDYVFTSTKKRKRPPDEESSSDVVDEMMIRAGADGSIKVVGMTTAEPLMSPLSAGTVSPLQEEVPNSSPDHHHHHHHHRVVKPWFQRKRKPKLQQTRLSFSG